MFAVRDGAIRPALRVEARREGRADPGADARARRQYPRYGYRRIRIFLRRRGIERSPERCYRLWRKAKLQLPKKRPRKRVASGRPRPTPPNAANDVWAYDFVFDACADGRQIKCLTVVDEWTRECLAIDVAGSIRSGRVIDSAHIDPGKPWQNGTNDSVNDKFRDECLSLEWFRSRAEAKVAIALWRKHCNRVRPHSSLGDMTPSEFRRKYCHATSNSTGATLESQLVF